MIEAIILILALISALGVWCWRMWFDIGIMADEILLLHDSPPMAALSKAQFDEFMEAVKDRPVVVDNE